MDGVYDKHKLLNQLLFSYSILYSLYKTLPFFSKYDAYIFVFIVGTTLFANSVIQW